MGSTPASVEAQRNNESHPFGGNQPVKSSSKNQGHSRDSPSYTALLAEANKVFGNSRPFFATTTRDPNPPDVFMLNGDGSVPPNFEMGPFFTTIIEKWTDHFTFRTVVVPNGERWIIKYDRSGLNKKMGACWKRWLGVNRGFTSKPCMASVRKKREISPDESFESSTLQFREASPELPQSSCKRCQMSQSTKAMIGKLGAG